MTRWTEKAAMNRTKRRFDSIRKTLRTVEEDWGHDFQTQSLGELINEDLDRYLREKEGLLF